MIETTDLYKSVLESGDYNWELKAFIIPKTTEANKAFIKQGTFPIEYYYPIGEEGGGEVEYETVTYDNIKTMQFISNATSESEFSLGCVASNSFEFSLFNEQGEWNNINFNAAMVVPRLILKQNGDTMGEIQLGVFFVGEVKYGADDIMCYSCDAMMKFDKKLKTTFKTQALEDEFKIEFPCSVSEMVRRICYQAGVGFSVENPEREFVITSDKKLKKLTLRTILSYAAELMCARAFIDYNGLLKIKTFSSTNETVKTISWEELEEFTAKGGNILIDGVACNYTDKYSTSHENTEDEPEFLITLTEDNPLFYGKSETSFDNIVRKIFNNIVNLEYMPCEISLFEADPSIQAGDFLEIEDNLGNSRKILVSKFTIKDNLSMEIISAGEGAAYQSAGDANASVISSVVYGGIAEETLEEDYSKYAWIGAEQALPFPSPNCAVMLNDELHVFGCSSISEHARKHYKLIDGEYENVTNTPVDFDNGCAVVFEGKIHYFGTEYPANKIHYTYDGNTWVLYGETPFLFGSRTGQNIAVINDEIHLIGSMFSNSVKCHYAYDGHIWRNVSELPVELHSGNAFLINGKVCIVGCDDNGEFFNVYEYDGTWKIIYRVPYMFYEGNVGVIGSKMHFIGGGNSKKYHYTNDCEGEFLTNLPCEFWQGRILMIKNEINIFGGLDSEYTHYKFVKTT